MTHYRDIFKHSAVYGIGQILGRFASILLLPLYTHYLRPADYGCIAILDLTSGVLGILIGGGMAAAVSRYHFEAVGVEAQNRVWWTGLVTVATVATLVVFLTAPFRYRLAALTLGSQELAGGHYYALVLSALWCNTVMRIPDHLRVRKLSWLSVTLSLVSLLVNVALNVYFLTVAHLGVAGILWGNLVTGATMAVANCAIFVWAYGAPQFHWPLAAKLWKFWGPIVLAGLLAMVMHQADRYLLRLYLDLDQVGVYAFAYAIGQSLNTMILIPFSTIFSVVIYEIAQQPEPERAFVRLFEYFVYGLTLLLLGFSLFLKRALALLVPADYAPAARLVPIVCPAFVFYSSHDHFKVPALLAKRTETLVFAYALGAVANIVFNMLIIPTFGAAGAAWTSVATYGVFSGAGLIGYRKIERFDYPLRRCAFVLLAMIASYAACEYFDILRLHVFWSLAVRGLVWTIWAAGLSYWVWRQWPRMPGLLMAS